MNEQSKGIAHAGAATELPPLPKPRAWMMEWPQHSPSFTTDKSDYVSWFTADQMREYACAALSGAAPTPQQPVESREVALLLNRLILMASAKATQPAGMPPEDRITDAEVDALEAQILALFATPTEAVQGQEKQHG